MHTKDREPVGYPISVGLVDVTYVLAITVCLPFLVVDFPIHYSVKHRYMKAECMYACCRLQILATMTR